MNEQTVFGVVYAHLDNHLNVHLISMSFKPKNNMHFTSLIMKLHIRIEKWH